MKKLSLLLILFVSVGSFANNNPWDFKPYKSTTAQTLFDPEIVYTGAQYFDANYWYWGQNAGYFFVLGLFGHQYGTWELSVDVQVTNGVTSYMKTFTFLVEGWDQTENHTHVLEMNSQLSPGEFIEFAPYISVNHWWLVS
jgi:hypothetical protein